MDLCSDAASKARWTEDLHRASEHRDRQPPYQCRSISTKKVGPSMILATDDEGASSDNGFEGGQIRDDATAIQHGKHSAKRYWKVPMSTSSLSCLLVLLNMLTSGLLFFCIDQTVTMIWSISFLWSLCMFIITWSLTLTMWLIDVLLRFITPVTLSFFIHNVWGSFAGMFGLYLTTGYAAGLLGYTLAERDLCNNHSNIFIKSRNDLAIWGPSFYLSLLSVVFGIRILWVSCSYTPLDAADAVSEVSVTLDICFFLWTFFIHAYLLNQSVITYDAFSMVLYILVVGIVLLRGVCLILVGDGMVVIISWLSMTILAGFLGYSIALYHCYKEQLLLLRSRVKVFVESAKSKMPKKPIESHKLHQL